MGSEYTINGDWLIHHGTSRRIRLSAVAYWYADMDGNITLSIGATGHMIMLTFTRKENLLNCIRDLDEMAKGGTK